MLNMEDCSRPNLRLHIYALVAKHMKWSGGSILSCQAYEKMVRWTIFEFLKR